MSNATLLIQKINTQLQDLPEAQLHELARCLRFLRYQAKQRKTKTKAKPISTSQIIRLEGLLADYDFSPEMLTEARREMWKKFQDPQP